MTDPLVEESAPGRDSAHARPRRRRRVIKWAIVGGAAVAILGLAAFADSQRRADELAVILAKVADANVTLNDFYDRIDDDSSDERRESEANKTLTRLIVARERMNELVVLPWHRKVATARARFNDYYDLFEPLFRVAAAGSTREGDAAERFTENDARYRLACTAARRAVGRADAAKLRSAIGDVCEGY